MALHKAIDIANWFIAKREGIAGIMTNLKVQKMLYYSEAWTQVLLGKELFAEQIQAWSSGPVVPDVFYALKEHDWNEIPAPDSQVVQGISPKVEGILKQVYDAYATEPEHTLELMAQEDAPWVKARGELCAEARCEVVIQKSEIRDLFREKCASDID